MAKKVLKLENGRVIETDDRETRPVDRETLADIKRRVAGSVLGKKKGNRKEA